MKIENQDLELRHEININAGATNTEVERGRAAESATSLIVCCVMTILNFSCLSVYLNSDFDFSK